jgi:hypothetical protein
MVGSTAFAQGKPGDKPPAAKPAMPPAAKPAAPAAAAPAMAAKPAAPAPAAAAPAAPPPPPKPAPELDATFKFLEGSWKCDSKFPAGSMGPGSPEMSAKSNVKFKKVLNGFYYLGEYELKKTKTMPGFKASFYFGYQPAAKMYTTNSVDDSGGSEFATSTGFQADTMTFAGEGYMMGQKVKIRESMTKKGEKEVLHKFEVDMGKGFQPMGEDSCKK